MGKYFEQFGIEIKEAMKAKDEIKLGTLRMVKTAIDNAAIAKSKTSLEDAEELEIIQKQAKQRRESIESFEKGGRTELAEKEKAELAVLEAYLPKQLSDDEITSICKEVIASVGATSMAQMGAIMKELMPKVKGKADGARVQKILKSLF